MILKAHVYGAEPWIINPGVEGIDFPLGHSLEEAFAEAADQTASDAGSDLLESPDYECREAFAEEMAAAMERSLRGPGDRYRAPDGVLYTLEEE